MNSAAVYISVFVLFACVQLGTTAQGVQAQGSRPAQKPAVFRVTYVSEGAVYIDAGRDADLREGMRLSVVEAPGDGVASDGVRFRGDAHIAELRATSVADSTSVCEVVEVKGELNPGELAFLTPDSVEVRHNTESLAEADRYPIVVTFTYGDPLDEEMREAVEKPAIQETPLSNFHGRFGLDYGGTIEDGGFQSKQVGAVIDADYNHIGGTFWNFTGNWRGDFTTSSSSAGGTGTPTLTDLIDRTYHLGFTYQSPYSPDIIGVGRLFLPWAPSLSTIDGGYIGRKVSRLFTVGIFAGSTPDPTSWSYAPNQHIAGTFVNYETGGFDRAHYFSTAGIAVSTLEWRVSRQFAFFENNFSWKRYVTFYNSMQIDAARTSPLPNGGSNPTGFSQSYTSLHIQPIHWFTVGVNHNYFRNLPTFNPLLVGTGLLDKYLFQGFSGDVRFELPKRVTLYSSLGESKVSTDTKSALNQAYGVTFGQLWKSGLIADVHYSKFNSTFGGGQYASASISQNLSDNFHVQLLGGRQIFNSTLTSNSRSNFVNGIADMNISSRFFLEGNIGWYQGTTLNYRQWSTVLGYRFGGYRK